MKPRTRCLLTGAGLALVLFGPGRPAAQASAQPARDQQTIDRLIQDSGGTALVSLARATGVPRFVRLVPGKPAVKGGKAEDVARGFLANYHSMYGLNDDAAELQTVLSETDALKVTHVAFQQVYRGVPVFAGIMRAHVDSKQRLTAVNGTFVPGINVDTKPSLSAEKAGTNALLEVKNDRGDVLSDASAIKATRLYVYRMGLAKGVPGQDYLVYEVEIGNGRDIREFVYVDAHSGKVVDRVSGIYEGKQDDKGDKSKGDGKDKADKDKGDKGGKKDKHPNAISRTVYQFNLGGNILWTEGDPFPTGNDDVDGIVPVDLNTYDYYANISGGSYIGYDNLNSPFLSTVTAPGGPGGAGCPNANWDGASTNFCPGVTGSDVVAHEWSHAYTQFTHGLIYAWQSGALNEAYSDINGNTVQHYFDLQTPDEHRNDGKCSVYSPIADRTVRVTTPADIAGDYRSLAALFGGDVPQDENGLEGDYVLVNDADGNHFGCTLPFANDVSGKIALIDRGGVPERCEFGLKALNAEQSGAVAVVVLNDMGDDLLQMSPGAVGDQVTIPAVMIGQTDGETLKSKAGELIQGAVLYPPGVLERYSDDSKRWLIGEDSPGFGGPIRDMWDPTCHGNAGKTTDTQYHCTADDAGGVHSNSGVPNHAYALIVDGGTYNGQTITGLGYTKATSIYWRAESIYQVPTTDFADHADALEQSCSDLIGATLYDPGTGAESSDVISQADCDQVAAAAVAVELRSDPLCDFQPLLAKDPPPLCEGGPLKDLFFDDFESQPQGWTLTNEGAFPEYIPRDWAWVNTLPGGRAGSGFFALDSLDLGNCGDDNQTGAMYLDSPPINIPDQAGPVRLAFQHYVATEAGFDGGNVKVRVNGGDWVNTEPEDFDYNPYNLQIPAEPPAHPLHGEWVWSGADGGELTGSWGESQANLPPDFVVTGGDQLQYRFALGVDGCNGLDGWYVDDVHVYSCGQCEGRLEVTPQQGKAPIISVDLHHGRPVTVTKLLTFALLNDARAVVHQWTDGPVTFKPGDHYTLRKEIPGLKSLAPGRYTLTLKLEGMSGFHTLEREFEISGSKDLAAR